MSCRVIINDIAKDNNKMTSLSYEFASKNFSLFFQETLHVFKLYLLFKGEQVIAKQSFHFIQSKFQIQVNKD